MTRSWLSALDVLTISVFQDKLGEITIRWQRETLLPNAVAVANIITENILKGEFKNLQDYS